MISQRPLTSLSRRELREMGLTTGGVTELYEQAQDDALAQGCTCGVTRITPRPSEQRGRHFHVLVFHEPYCPLHPLAGVHATPVWWRRWLTSMRPRRSSSGEHEPIRPHGHSNRSTD